MTVYVDVLIFTNTIINYCIISAAGRLTHIPRSQLRMIASAFISSFSSLLLFCGRYSEIAAFGIRIAVCIVASAIAFRFRHIKEIFIRGAAILAVSVIFCGAMAAVYEWFKPPNMAIINDIVYFRIDPLPAVGLSFAVYIIIISVRKLLNKKFGDTVVRLKVTISGAQYDMTAKIDTGCTVVEPFSGDPVIIAEKSAIGSKELIRPRVIPYKTINRESLLLASKADSIEIDGKTIDKSVYIAVTESVDKYIKAIINAEIVR